MSSPRAESRREATKRQIMGVLIDNHENQELLAHHPKKKSPPQIDGTDPDHLRLLIDDVKQQLAQQKEILAAETQKGKEEQHYAHSSGMMKLTKSIKKMTIRDFNRMHNCDLIKLFKSVKGNHIESVAGKKRIRQDLETPAPARGGRSITTPATASRTVRRGEALFSMNGSPVDAVDEGSLVATVSKKPRGKSSIVFDINVGEGRYINLADPGTVKHLDATMKTEAKSQLLAMQEQMAVLMAQLET